MAKPAEPHWCDELRRAVEDRSCATLYRPHLRAYGVPLIDQDENAEPYYMSHHPGQAMRLVSFWFCPFCGDTLPGDLYEKRANVAVKGYKIPRETERWAVPGDMPQELFDETWWRRRKIGVTNPVASDPRERPQQRGSGWIDTGRGEAPPGLSQAECRSPHACTAMMATLEDEREMLYYLPHVREYGIRILEAGQPINDQLVRIWPIRFCPWCADPLPPSLRTTWEKELSARALTPNDPDEPTNLPTEMCTDIWWRNAGL
ncbi:MAG: hypothetical protein HUJ16_06000 [Kangiella sp.]|nr:hypothetical protein [Kangiella sp.]